MLLRHLYARTHVSPHSNFETAPVVEPVASVRTPRYILQGRVSNPPLRREFVGRIRRAVRKSARGRLPSGAPRGITRNLVPSKPLPCGLERLRNRDTINAEAIVNIVMRIKKMSDMTRRRVTVEDAPGMGALAGSPATEREVLLDRLNADASKVYDTGERIFATIKEEMERKHWGSYIIINVDNGQHIIAPSLSDARQMYVMEFGQAKAWCTRIGVPILAR